MIHLLNTAIIPAGCDGRWEVKPLSLEAARAYLQAHEWASHIGHASTAALASALLGAAVPMDRTPWDGTGRALVVQLTFRGEEGRVYTAQEMAEFHAEGKIALRLLEWLDQPQP